MMTVQDVGRYRAYRESRGEGDRFLVYELWLPVLLFGGVGAITWAIRGTDGWGGIDGTLVPGLTWALLWCYICFRRGVDGRCVLPWLALGLALGGELGYGQYVAWVQGVFHISDQTLPISPFTGFLWFIVCGIGWGAPGGIMLGWALQGAVSRGRWVERALLIAVLLVLLFNLPLSPTGAGLNTWVGEQVARHCPALLFPRADLGLYEGMPDRHLVRTMYANTQNFLVLVWWLVVMGMAALRRERATVMSGLVIGGGFGVGFAVSGLWCLGYSHAPQWIDWWKVWELHAGFNLGALYALALFRAMRRLDSVYDKDGAALRLDHAETDGPWVSPSLAAGGFVLIFVAGMEFFFWTGIALASFFALAMLLGAGSPAGDRSERRKRIAHTYSVFLLLFMLCHGGVSRTGVFLELYDADAVDQYAWPAGRVALFAPLALLLFAGAVIHMWRQRRTPLPPPSSGTRLPERFVDLFAFIGLVGAVSIWPSKIGALYAAFLCVSLCAFTRMNRLFASGDSEKDR